jgi:hypothetical protein
METTKNQNMERGDVRSIDCSADSGNHPCPFCNCDETYVAKSGALTCANCQARGPWDHRAFGDDEKDEVEMWNLRMAHTEELRLRDAKIRDLERKLHQAEQTIDQLNERIIEEDI